MRSLKQISLLSGLEGAIYIEKLLVGGREGGREKRLERLTTTMSGFDESIGSVLWLSPFPPVIFSPSDTSNDVGRN